MRPRRPGVERGDPHSLHPRSSPAKRPFLHQGPNPWQGEGRIEWAALCSSSASRGGSYVANRRESQTWPRRPH